MLVFHLFLCWHSLFPSISPGSVWIRPFLAYHIYPMYASSLTCPKVENPNKNGIRKIFFLTLYKNICWGYSLEVPQWGTSNKYHKICFDGETRKNSKIFVWKKNLFCKHVKSPILTTCWCWKCCEWITNRTDLDQIAPSGAVWSGSTVFVEACLSENLG